MDRTAKHILYFFNSISSKPSAENSLSGLLELVTEWFVDDAQSIVIPQEEMDIIRTLAIIYMAQGNKAILKKTEATLLRYFHNFF